MNLNKKNLAKSVALIALAGLTMANKECQKQPVSSRQLKKNVRILGVEASTFMDNVNGSGFNFSEVAKSQMSGVLFEGGDFYERNLYPNLNQTNTKTSTGQLQKTISISDDTLAKLQQQWPTIKKAEVLLDTESSCLITRPQHLLYTKINSLEAYSGAGLVFGFNQNMAQLPLSAQFKMNKMRMDLSSHAYDPWSMEKVASVNTEAFKKDYSASFGIDLGIIHIGPEFYRVTGMAEVVLSGLKTAMKSLSEALLQQIQGQEWKTRVIVNKDNAVALLGGAELGIKVGDRFKISNELHQWEGVPCGDYSRLISSVAVTADPWIVEVTNVGDRMSFAKILNPKEDQTIEVGALVTVDQLYVEPPPAKAAAPAQN